MHSRANRLRGSNANSIKHHNRAVVVRALLQHGALSRHILTALTNLRPSTITNVVNQLMDADLVEELGPDTSVTNPIGGRYPILVDVRTDGCYALAIQFAPTFVCVASVSLKGQVVYQEHMPVARGSAPEQVTQAIAVLAHRALRAVDRGRVVGAGIAALGLVDPETGINEYVAYHDWHHVPFADWLGEQLHLPITIENGARAMALAEHWYGAGRGVDDLILITVGESVGAGMIIDGQIYRGQAGLAGEIGHTVVVENGPRCDCGKDGCLEAVSSTQAIARLSLARDHALRIPGTIVDDGQAGRLAIAEKILSAAATGNPAAVDIVREVVHPLAVAVANLTDVLDPEQVIISGSLLRAGELVLDTIREAVRDRSLVPPERQAHIIRAALGAEVGTIGAATLAFEQFLNHRETLSMAAHRRTAALAVSAR